MSFRSHRFLRQDPHGSCLRIVRLNYRDGNATYKFEKTMTGSWPMLNRKLQKRAVQKKAVQSLHSKRSLAVGARLSSIRTYLGLHPLVPIDDEHEDLEHHELLRSRIRLNLREAFAEFFGGFHNGHVRRRFCRPGSVSSNSTGNASIISTSAPGGARCGSYQSISWR